MSLYYFHDGKEQSGPYTVEELKGKPISSETPIWRIGLTNWVKAGELEELGRKANPIPPPYLKPSVAEKTGARLGRNLQIAGICLLILIIASYIYNRTQTANGFVSPRTLVDPERSNPPAFLQAGGTYRPNFWRTQWNVSGSISNKASHTNYKDVVVKVVFLTQTNTVIDTKYYTVYDYFPYGLQKAFTLTLDKPSIAATCGWQVVKATVY